MPAGVAADWLVTAWDQNTAMAEPTPGVSALEAVTADWLLELLDLPRAASVAFVTGAQVANLVCLAAARHRVLADVGWDVEADGLVGAPAVTVLAGEFVHHTIGKAVRILGLGESRTVTVRCRRQRPHATRRAAARPWPGSPALPSCAPRPVRSPPAASTRWPRSPTSSTRDAARPRPGCTSTARSGCSDGRRTLLAPKFAGAERADSWCTDAHKWLEHPVRLRDRDRPRPRGAPPRDDAARVVPAAARCRP